MTSRVYRNINTPIKIGGLELMDIAGLAIFSLLVLNFCPWFSVGFILIMGAYACLRRFKKGKPPGYAAHLFKFVLGRKEYRAAAAELAGRDPGHESG